MSEMEATENLTIKIEPIDNNEAESEEDLDTETKPVLKSPEPEIRRDKRGRIITQKKTDAARRAAAASKAARDEKYEKARRYDEIQRLGSVDYDKLVEMLSAKLPALQINSEPKQFESTFKQPKPEPEIKPVQRYRQPREHILF